MTITGVALLAGRAFAPSRLPKGTFFAPTGWPAANSAGSQTSISTPFSRLIRRTASLADTLPPPAPESDGRSSIAPDVTASSTSIQFSRRKSNTGKASNQENPRL